jgi:hypothetical protein
VVEGVNSIMKYLIHCKNLCKCHNIPPIKQRNKKEKEKKEPKDTIKISFRAMPVFNYLARII